MQTAQRSNQDGSHPSAIWGRQPPVIATTAKAYYRVPGVTACARQKGDQVSMSHYHVHRHLTAPWRLPIHFAHRCLPGLSLLGLQKPKRTLPPCPDSTTSHFKALRDKGAISGHFKVAFPSPPLIFSLNKEARWSRIYIVP